MTLTICKVIIIGSLIYLIAVVIYMIFWRR